MKHAQQLFKAVLAIIVTTMVLASCEATVKVPKHPAPGEPPPPPKVDVNR